MAIHNFRELKIWQKSRSIVTDMYKLTDVFPESEKFGIINQIRRASISISSNISEGAGRGSDKDFSRFLDMAEGSANELLNLLFLSYDLKFVELALLNFHIENLEELIKMINGFRKKLNVK